MSARSLAETVKGGLESGMLMPFRVATSPPVDDSRRQVAGALLLDLELDQPVVDQDALAGVEMLQQLGVVQGELGGRGVGAQRDHLIALQ